MDIYSYKERKQNDIDNGTSNVDLSIERDVITIKTKRYYEETGKPCNDDVIIISLKEVKRQLVTRQRQVEQLQKLVDDAESLI